MARRIYFPNPGSPITRMPTAWHRLCRSSCPKLEEKRCSDGKANSTYLRPQSLGLARMKTHRYVAAGLSVRACEESETRH